MNNQLIDAIAKLLNMNEEEKSIMEAITCGESASETAVNLGCKPRHVEYLRNRLCQKLSAKNPRDLLKKLKIFEKNLK